MLFQGCTFGMLYAVSWRTVDIIMSKEKQHLDDSLRPMAVCRRRQPYEFHEGIIISVTFAKVFHLFQVGRVSLPFRPLWSACRF